MDLAQIKVYRITHIDNVPHILQHGITHKRSKNANPDFITIGDISLIDTRGGKAVIADNGDLLNFGAPSITLGDFIPFYFGIKMPMLYVIQHGGNFVESATPPKDIVYLACSLSRILKLSNDCYYSDGHATDNLTTFYDKSKINDLPTVVDWDAVKASYWGGQENLNIKRKKQAEFLASNDLPPNCIIGFVCYNESAKKKLQTMGVEEEKIRVIPNAYY
ncbi:MAG TPA: DUF4433 domain-containing protein [Ginsengibacter sp.]